MILKAMTSRIPQSFLVLFMLSAWMWPRCNGDASFSFDVHHRFSDPVKAMLNIEDELPEKGTMDYYHALAHRDHSHGRRLAGKAPLTFSEGNATFRIDDLGFLYYANVSIGTPEKWFLVALDTGSGLLWLPCDCGSNCLRSFNFTTIEGFETIDFNVYSLSSSSTGEELPCTSPYCDSACSPENRCPYKVEYLSADTSSTGYIVLDTLHLTTDSGPSKATNVQIAFGCGVTQTGHFLEDGAPNGLFGISMDPISLPSILARQKIVANSFSMCFSYDGIGRISFGDKGSNSQGETPINPNLYLNSYTVSITNVSVGNNVAVTNLDAIFDTGTSFTLLTDPVYSFITEKFDSLVQDTRVSVDPESAFQFCYHMSSKVSDLIVPQINLTMKGGAQLPIVHPWIGFMEGRTNFYCLAIIRSDQDINIIGENFMTGYRVVFDNEKPAISWKRSECGEGVPFTPISMATGNSTGKSVSQSSLLHIYIPIAVLMVQVLSVQLRIL